MDSIRIWWKTICDALSIDLLSLSKCSHHKHKMAATVFFLHHHLTVLLLSLSTSSFHKNSCISETIEFPSFQRQLEAARSNLSPKFWREHGFPVCAESNSRQCNECWSNHLDSWIRPICLFFCKQSEKVRHIRGDSNTLKKEQIKGKWPRLWGWWQELPPNSLRSTR